MSKHTTSTVALAKVAALRAQQPARFGTQELLAKATGLHQTTWSHYLRGVARPGKHERKTLRRRLGIDPVDWDTPCESFGDLTIGHDGTVTVDRSPEFSQTAGEAT